MRMIVTFQDGAEALLAIAAQALSAARAAPASAQAFWRIAGDACACVLQLAKQGAVAQKYMREAGHITAVTRTLRVVIASLEGSTQETLCSLSCLADAARWNAWCAEPPTLQY